MIQRLSNPQSVLFWWLAIGLLLGLSIGMAINSFTVGLPLGIVASVWAAKVISRVCQGLLAQ
jgi:hypothetical protein